MTLWSWPVITLSFEKLLSLGRLRLLLTNRMLDTFPQGVCSMNCFQEEIIPPPFNGHVYSSTALPTDGKKKQKNFTLTGVGCSLTPSDEFILFSHVRANVS